MNIRSLSPPSNNGPLLYPWFKDGHIFPLDLFPGRIWKGVWKTLLSKFALKLHHQKLTFIFQVMPQMATKSSGCNETPWGLVGRSAGGGQKTCSDLQGPADGSEVRVPPYISGWLGFLLFVHSWHFYMKWWWCGQEITANIKKPGFYELTGWSLMNLISLSWASVSSNTK